MLNHARLKSLARANSLVFWAHSQVTKKMKSCSQGFKIERKRKFTGFISPLSTSAGLPVWCAMNDDVTISVGSAHGVTASSRRCYKTFFLFVTDAAAKKLECLGLTSYYMLVRFLFGATTIAITMLSRKDYMSVAFSRTYFTIKLPFIIMNVIIQNFSMLNILLHFITIHVLC